MNIRDILNQVLSQSGFLTRASFFTSADPDDVQMVSIANRVSYEIFNFYNWDALRVTDSIVTTEAAGKPVELYDLPDDFQTMVPDSVWELDGSRPVEFPVPENRWYMYQFSSLSDGGLRRARLNKLWTKFKMNYQLEIYQPPAGETLVFEYITNTPIRSSSDTPQELFEADTDNFIMDDQLLILGVQAHWAQTKLMPQYQEWYANYMKKMNEAIGRDVGGKTIGGAYDGGAFGNRGAPYYPLWQR